MDNNNRLYQAGHNAKHQQSANLLRRINSFTNIYCKLCIFEVNQFRELIPYSIFQENITRTGSQWRVMLFQTSLPLGRYAAWSELAVSELQLSAATSLWLYHQAASLPSWIEFNCLRSAAVGKAARLSINWLDAACRSVIPLRQVALAQLYKYHHQSGNVASGKLVWKQHNARCMREWYKHFTLSFISRYALYLSSKPVQGTYTHFFKNYLLFFKNTSQELVQNDSLCKLCERMIPKNQILHSGIHVKSWLHTSSSNFDYCFEKNVTRIGSKWRVIQAVWKNDINISGCHSHQDKPCICQYLLDQFRKLPKLFSRKTSPEFVQNDR